jgi:hypothetical protein
MEEKDSFLDVCLQETISFVTVETGDTLIIPPGYIRAVFTEEDTIASGGNIFDIHYMTMHLSISEMEDNLLLNKDTHCPFFAELCLFLLSYLLESANLNFCMQHKDSVLKVVSSWKQCNY